MIYVVSKTERLYDILIYSFSKSFLIIIRYRSNIGENIKILKARVFQ
jgi:hypothetical protein